jgi:hypothetical protein
MSPYLEILWPARDILVKLDSRRVDQMYTRLEELEVDPFTPRPGMEIIKIECNRSER